MASASCTSVLLAQAGARVVATDLDGEGAAQTARLCTEHGSQAWSFAHDVTSEQDWQRVVAQVGEQAEATWTAWSTTPGAC
ncbi:SDR family oxidoreductase [Achromobacter xylosoxidans]